MNPQFYEIEVRQRLQSRLDEAARSRLIRMANPRLRKFSLRKTLRAGWTAFQTFVLQLLSTHSTNVPVGTLRHSVPQSPEL